MPITIKMASHAAEIIPNRSTSFKNPLELLESACPNEHKSCKELLQSSFTSLSSSYICPLSKGFVHTAIEAYNNHYHLQIRPEDVWFAIHSPAEFLHQPTRRRATRKVCRFWRKKGARTSLPRQSLHRRFWTNSRSYYRSDWKEYGRFRVERVVHAGIFHHNRERQGGCFNSIDGSSAKYFDYKILLRLAFLPSPYLAKEPTGPWS